MALESEADTFIGRLIQAFGEKMGIDGLKLDADNEFSLMFDNSLVVNARWDPNEFAFIFFSEVIKGQTLSSEKLYDLLECNLQTLQDWKPIMAYNRDTDSVLLVARIHINTLSSVTIFEGVFENFINSLELWHSHMEKPSEFQGIPQATPTTGMSMMERNVHWLQV